MKYVRTAEIPLAEIEVPKRLRPVDPDEVASLQESLKELGQITPIQVVEQLRGKRKYRLVVGAHRRAGVEALGWETIRAEVFKPAGKSSLELELREIDENLARHGLNPADRARFVGRRLEILKKQHPEAFGRGGDRKSAAAIKGGSPTFDFSQEVQALLKCSHDRIKRAIYIYDKLGPDLLERLQHTHLAKREGDLYDLGRYPPTKQNVIVDWCLERVAAGDEPGNATVALGRRLVEPGAQPVQNPSEAQANKLRLAWDRAGKKARRQHLEFLEKIGVIPSFTMDHL